VVKHLLSENREIVNSADKDGQLPLHLLSTQANRLGPDQKNERNNATKCLDLYLNAAPRATADFFTALQALPGFLRQQAVVTPLVQDVLNYKISKRFPTMILILDFYFIVLIIVFFRLAVSEAVNLRFPNEYFEIYGEEPQPLTWWYLLFLYFGGLYFLLREIIQMISLASLGLFKTWLFDGVNALDVSCIFIVFFWAIVMQTNSMMCPQEQQGDTVCIADDQFRSGTAVSTIFIWLLVLSFLKSTLIDFAVFVNGLFYVVQRLVAFLLALVVILVGFAQMFVTVFQGSPQCVEYLSLAGEDFDTRMDAYFPFCDFWNALLKVYTMLLGEVDETLFVSSKAATWLFVAFMFLVVILLANVLIAIVTDRYVVIKNQRAQIVFWSNRLDYVAEIDLISSGPWITKVISALQCRCCIGGPRERALNTQQDIEDDYAANLKDTFGQGAWKNLIALYEDQDLSALSLEFYCYLVFRFAAGIFLIPLWLIVGLASAGFLWPPQVREWLFVQRIAKRSKGDTLQEQRLYQMNELKAEVKKLQEEIKDEMTTDRKEVDGMKTQLTQMKSEMTTEMKQIKEIMTMLYDLQSSNS
jgi:hypothetical protein